MDLDQLLARPSLAAGERLLVAAKVTIAGPEWPRLAACVRTARSRNLPRVWLEETLLQAVLFYGFPRLISAFEVLATEWPAERPPHGGGLDPDQQLAAGRALFATIYGTNTDTVLTMLRTHHGELHDFVLEAAYARILTRPALTPRQRELLAVGALAALQQLPQLIAHARGALACGAGKAEVREAMFTALLQEPVVDDLMRKVRWPQ